jgi:hypothetical protein
MSYRVHIVEMSTVLGSWKARCEQGGHTIMQLKYFGRPQTKEVLLPKGCAQL